MKFKKKYGFKKKKYWKRKKQIRKRKKYTAGESIGRGIGDVFDYALPDPMKFMGDFGAWVGSKNDDWRYKRKIYNKKIRIYKRIGSRPYLGPIKYWAPRPSGYVAAPSGVGRYRKFS